MLTIGEDATPSDPNAPPPPPPSPPLARVRCIVYAAPACVDRALADRLRLDSQLIAVVHNDDGVPRLSDATCRQLAAELLADDAMYHERLAADTVAYKTYVKTLGRTQPMCHVEGTEITAPKSARGSAITDQSPAADGAMTDTMADAVESVPGEAGGGGDASEAGAREPLGGDEAMVEATLVVPGRVVLLMGREASVTAVEGDSRLPTLGRLIVSQVAVVNRSNLFTIPPPLAPFTVPSRSRRLPRPPSLTVPPSH